MFGKNNDDSLKKENEELQERIKSLEIHLANAKAAIGHLREAADRLCTKRRLGRHLSGCKCAYCTLQHALSATSGYE